MRIGAIVQANQPNIHNQLNERHKKKHIFTIPNKEREIEQV